MPVEGLVRNARCIGFTKDGTGAKWAMFEPGKARRIDALQRKGPRDQRKKNRGTASRLFRMLGVHFARKALSRLLALSPLLPVRRGGGLMQAKTPLLIYLAGPYTKPDPVENTHRMIRIADALLDAGVVPVVPHLTMFWHLVCPRPYEQWLAYDLHVMARCDVVLRVPGESNGADREVYRATRSGQPVIIPASAAVEDCVAAVKAWLNAGR